ncbi:MAG: hypothetical protein HY292_22675 [Planctomycetes bacterium]|nr:hypothetical protein [Planctomycetota bacterium]
MTQRSLLLGLLCGLGIANVALASGGTVRPATNGAADYIYRIRGGGSGPNDRAITRYGREGQAFPNGSEFDPNSVICGARSFAGHQSSVSFNRPNLCDIRFEDPNRPGFPEVTALVTAGASTIPAGADSNASPSQCPANVSFQNYTFNGGSGIPDPLVAVFLTWQWPGSSSPDSCELGLETSAPDNHRCKYYDSQLNIYGQVGANHWLDAVVFTPFILDLNFRMSGSSQFPGDRGLPIWFIRGEEGNGSGSSTIIDDFLTTTVVIDNGTGGPLTSQTLSLVGDRSVINPKLTPKDLAASFRLLSNPKVSLASGNPYSWGPGRTILRANIPATISGKFEALFPINLPFVAASRNTALPLGTGPRDDERQELGLRRQRGQIDDGSSEVGSIVQGPALTGDILAQRWEARRVFPSRSGPTGAKVTSLSITALQLGAVSAGSATGFDAIQIRRDDPVVLNASDQTPQGLIAVAGSSGTVIGDGTRVSPPIPVDPNGAVAFFNYPISPAATVASADGSFWTDVYPFPGDIGGASPNGTFIGTDNTADTVLGESFTSQSGTQPYVQVPTGNFMMRTIFSASNPFVDDAPLSVPTVTQKGRVPLREVGKIPSRILRSGN